jgi:hypothetical protein
MGVVKTYGKARLRAGFGKAVCLLCAALCGMFVALGMRLFAEPSEVWAGANGMMRAAAALLFAATVAWGMSRRPAKMPLAVFASAQFATAFLSPESWIFVGMLALYPLLLLLLIFGVRWRGARFAVLPLTLWFALCFAPGDAVPPPPEFPDSLYLPASLMTERPGGRMLVLGDDVDGESFEEFPYLAQIDQVWSPGDPVDVRNCDVAVAGSFDDWCSDASRRGVYRWLATRLKPRGVLVMPRAETVLLPPGEWRFAALPGGDGEWLAARRGEPVEVDPEHLDRHLQFLCQDDPDDTVLLPGAFAAMFTLPPARGIAPPSRGNILFPTSMRQWALFGAAAVVWALLRLLLCRRERRETAVVAGEIMAAMMLYIFAVVPLWCEQELAVGIPLMALLAAVGDVLSPYRRSVLASRLLMCLGAVLGLCPFFFGCCWEFMPLVGGVGWLVAGRCGFSQLGAGNRRTVCFGAVAGVVAGIILCRVAESASGGALAPFLLPAAVLLLIPAWLRR